MEDELETSVHVEKIDLSEVVGKTDESHSSSGYDTGPLASTATSWLAATDRLPDTDRSELQDVISLDASLGTTLFTKSQYNKSMEESAKMMMQDLNYHEAAVLLEGVDPMSCRQQLLLTECYLQIGQEYDAKFSIGHASRLMTSSLRLRVHDVTGAIRKAVASANYVKAIILLQCAPRYGFLKLVPNEAAFFIERRVADYNRVVRALVKQKGRASDIAQWFVKECMLDIILLFREISGAKFRQKATCEARILAYFGLSYREIGEHSKSLECFQQGLELLSLAFDDQVFKFKTYGALMQNAGLQLETLGQLDEAEWHYVTALEAFTETEDWENTNDKKMSVKKTILNLEIVREKLQNLAMENEKIAQELFAEKEASAMIQEAFADVSNSLETPPKELDDAVSPT